MLPRLSSRVSGFPVASPYLWGKLRNLSLSKVSKQVVMSFCVTGMALCDIPTCLITRRKCQNSRGSRTKCSFCSAHVFRLESLVFLWHRRVYGGSCNIFPFSKVSKEVVMSFCVAGMALCDIPTCCIPCHKFLCEAGATMRSTLYTLHCTLHTLYFTLHTPHFTLHTPHSTLSTPPSHSTLYTLHSTIYTLDSSLHIPHFTLHTLHFALHTLHSSALHTPSTTLHHAPPHSTTPDSLHTPHSSLHTLHSTLLTSHSTNYTFHSTLRTPQFTV